MFEIRNTSTTTRVAYSNSDLELLLTQGAYTAPAVRPQCTMFWVEVFSLNLYCSCQGTQTVTIQYTIFALHRLFVVVVKGTP